MRKFFSGIILLIILAFAAIMFFTLGSRADANAPAERIVAGHGDTLWSIAMRVRPDEDPRLTIHRILALNKLSDTTIYPGQSIFVP